MKYLLALIMPFFIISCALEKEETSYVNGVFLYTIASINIDNVSGYTEPPACINFAQESDTSNHSSEKTIQYTIISSGKHGDDDVDSSIRNSEVRITRTRLYFNDIYIELPERDVIRYNDKVPKTIVITQDMLASRGITDGTYDFEIELVGTEYSGAIGGSSGIHTVSDNTFLSIFGQVQITSDGQGCQ